MASRGDEEMHQIRRELAELLEHNLTNHTPSPEKIQDIEYLRQESKRLARAIIQTCPISREMEVALERLEETMMYSAAAIARAEQ